MVRGCFIETNPEEMILSIYGKYITHIISFI